SRPPRATAGAVLRSQSGGERIAEFGKEQPEISEEGVLAIDDPAQDRGMPFRWQAFQDEAGAEQDREFAVLIGHMTSEKPRQIKKRHGAQIDRLTKPQSLERVVSVAFAARDGPDAQRTNARECKGCRWCEPDAP